MNIHKGLENIVADQTAISFVDGKNGCMYYRGYNIEELVEYSNFEECAFLIWHGKLPTPSEYEKFMLEFKEGVEFPEYIQKLLLIIPRYANNMDVLRTAISYASHFDSTIYDNTPHSLLRKAYKLANLFNTIIPNWYRIKRGEEYVLPDKQLSYSQNFLYQLSNTREISPLINKVLEIALILHLDHGFNASTFSARVSVSTCSDIYSAIASAIGTLKGNLHGGAGEQVIKMLFEIREPDNAKKFLDECFAKKIRIPGFGHRVYKIQDPRAKILKNYAIQLGQNHPEKSFIEIAEIVEKIMVEEKKIYPNVDFYSSIVYYYMGIRPELFTPVFALGRIVGWTAHIIEQLSNNKLIRPLENYIGPSNLHYIPIDKR
ncbi:MAG: citrate/2-methylcitrate synthase [Planctomycetota bacterium]